MSIWGKITNAAKVISGAIGGAISGTAAGFIKGFGEPLLPVPLWTIIPPFSLYPLVVGAASVAYRTGAGFVQGGALGAGKGEGFVSGLSAAWGGVFDISSEPKSSLQMSSEQQQATLTSIGNTLDSVDRSGLNTRRSELLSAPKIQSAQSASNPSPTPSPAPPQVIQSHTQSAAFTAVTSSLETQVRNAFMELDRMPPEHKKWFKDHNVGTDDPKKFLASYATFKQVMQAHNRGQSSEIPTHTNSPKKSPDKPTSNGTKPRM